MIDLRRAAQGRQVESAQLKPQQSRLGLGQCCQQAQIGVGTGEHQDRRRSLFDQLTPLVGVVAAGLGRKPVHRSILQLQ
jgi:hypothetical protein